MRRAAILLLLVLAPLAAARGAEAYARWRPLLADELARAAVDRPQDLYKFLFQGVMGPAHAVPDAAHARGWLEGEWRELEAAPVAPRPPLLRPLRPDGRLVRLDLVRLRALVSDDAGAAEAAALDTVAAAFAGTAGRWARDPALLADLWAALRADTTLWRPYFSATELAAFELERGPGWPAVHHSASYRRRHAPHYRVVDPALLPAGWRQVEESP
jgi:hypothetical protein